MDHAKLLDVLTSLPVSQSILPRAVCFATSRPANRAICSFIDSSGYASIVWCMKFKKALNKEKNTPIIRKDENGLKLKLIITSFNIRLSTLRKSVAS